MKTLSEVMKQGESIAIETADEVAIPQKTRLASKLRYYFLALLNLLALLMLWISLTCLQWYSHQLETTATANLGNQLAQNIAYSAGCLIGALLVGSLATWAVVPWYYTYENQFIAQKKLDSCTDYQCLKDSDCRIRFFTWLFLRLFLSAVAYWGILESVSVATLER